MADDGSVLGNLPSSRPGRRSGRRASLTDAQGTNGTAKPKAAAASPKVATAKPKARAAKPKAAAQPQPAKRRRTPPPPRRAPERRSDPVGETLRTAAKVAGAGLRATTGVATEIVRRLPRP